MDEWVSVERPKKSSFEENIAEQDPSIWVVFAKSLGAEKFLVRFPDDPKYTYITPEEIELTSSNQEGGTHLLRVLENHGSEILREREREIALQEGSLLIEISHPTADAVDLLYRSGGKWIWESLLLTPHHLYFFQTSGNSLIGDSHRQFVQSLDVYLLNSESSSISP